MPSSVRPPRPTPSPTHLLARPQTRWSGSGCAAGPAAPATRAPTTPRSPGLGYLTRCRHPEHLPLLATAPGAGSLASPALAGWPPAAAAAAARLHHPPPAAAAPLQGLTQLLLLRRHGAGAGCPRCCALWHPHSAPGRPPPAPPRCRCCAVTPLMRRCPTPPVAAAAAQL